ncbi:MAG: hypothetical protein ACREX7_01765 [Casimicrobiaceae bacterium]
MRRFQSLALLAFAALLPAVPAHALDRVDPYICPTALQGSGTDCFLEAVSQTYTMCRQVKSIEILEFGIIGAQQGVNGAKTEGCIEKHKRLIARPYQAALREAGRDKSKVQGLHKLYDTWVDDLAKLTPGPEEIDENYKQRVGRAYGDFNEQIKALREPQPTVVAAKKLVPKKKPARQTAARTSP